MSNPYLVRMTLFLAVFITASCGRDTVPTAQLAEAPTNENPEVPKGFDVGNGGDRYAGEFVEIGEEIVETLIHSPRAGIDSTAMLEAIRKTKVVSKDSLELDGKAIDAINYPLATPPRIEVNRDAWDRMKWRRHDKIFLVMHEYLGILGVDDSNYQISRRTDKASVCERTDQVRRALENEFKKSCYRITVDDLRFITEIDLSDEMITELKPKDFEYLYSLQTLNLSQNQLTSLPVGIFRDNPWISTLNLNSNRISRLDKREFSHFPRLKNLDIGFNRQFSIEEVLLEKFSVLESLVLSGNPVSPEVLEFLNGPSMLKHITFHARELEISKQKYSELSERLDSFSCEEAKNSALVCKRNFSARR